MLPVIACGVLAGVDALPWLRGKRDLFDPVGIVAALGLHFFFLAPLLHVYWDYWMPDVLPPPDWRPWIGGMATLNAAGLLLYRAIIARSARQRRTPRLVTVWAIDRPRFFAIGGVLVMATSVLQAWVYARSGGFSGYTEMAGSAPEAFAGMGWLFVLSESAPILGMMLFAVASDRVSGLRGPLVIGLTLTVFVGLSLVFGGFRGSRSNTVWAVFWAAGMVHYWVRPLSRPIVAAGVIGLVGFMYFYGFYKNVGADAQRAFSSRTERLELEAKTGRTVEALLLGDLARSDVQAFELYRLTAARDDYQLAWGRTYVGAVALLIPERLWPTRPRTKVVEGTDLLYGANAFRPGTFVASRVYGIGGELMLNFGPAAAPCGFVVLGLCVVATGRAIRRWLSKDARLLLAPVLVNLCFVIMVGDSDNVVGFVTKSLLVPAIFLMASTRRTRVNQESSVRRTETGYVLTPNRVPALQ